MHGSHIPNLKKLLTAFYLETHCQYSSRSNCQVQELILGCVLSFCLPDLVLPWVKRRI